MVAITFRDPTRSNPRVYEERLKTLSKFKRHQVPCCVCDRFAPYDVLGNKWDLQVVRCLACGHIYVNPQLDEDAVRLIYDRTYWDRLQPAIGSPTLEERLAFDYQNAVAKLHRDILPWVTTGNMLDVGCSNGALVKRACEYGFNAIGLEVSEDVAAVGQKVFGVEIRVGTVATAGLPLEWFDCVTMYDVIEHMFYPRRDLALVYSLLRNGGVVIVETLNTDSLNFQELGLDWDMVMPVEHVNYFSEANLVGVLLQTGFTVVESKCPHEDNVVVVAKKA